ncbi:MAG: DUF308 domain-containing protein [Lachnospiraceae bacterium]|nr:DUF308 domain-containing protein [Lachnospiraceae bacterium]
MEKKINKSIYITAGIYIILGLVMVLFPETTMKTFCLSLGLIAAGLGIINLVTYFSRSVDDSVYRYDFVSGIMLILVGIMFVVKMETVIEYIPVILGVLILLSGVIKLQHAIDLKRIDFNGWLYVLVFSLLCLSIGTVCVLQPSFIASTLVIIMGISFIFCGMTDLITLILLSKRMKQYVTDIFNNKDESVKDEESTENQNDEINNEIIDIEIKSDSAEDAK